jgi:hypothetical protein
MGQHCFRGCWEQDDGAEQWKDLVELVGIEPTTSTLRTMASAKKPQFGVHLAADYGPKRSSSARLAGSCLKLHCAGENEDDKTKFLGGERWETDTSTKTGSRTCWPSSKSLHWTRRRNEARMDCGRNFRGNPAHRILGNSWEKNTPNFSGFTMRQMFQSLSWRATSPQASEMGSALR